MANEFFLFGPSGVDKIERLKTKVLEECKDVGSLTEQIELRIIKNRNKQSRLKNKVTMLQDWIELDRKIERDESRLKRLMEGNKKKDDYIKSMDKINEAIKFEVEWKERQKRIQMDKEKELECEKEKEDKEEEEEEEEEVKIKMRQDKDGLSIPDEVSTNRGIGKKRKIITDKEESQGDDHQDKKDKRTLTGGNNDNVDNNNNNSNNNDNNNNSNSNDPTEQELQQALNKLQDAFVEAKRIGIFNKEMTIPSFINRNYCGTCGKAFLQLNEAKVACVCGIMEGNTEIPNTILYQEVANVADKTHCFDDVIDIFREKECPSELKQVAVEVMTELWLDQSRMCHKVPGQEVKKYLEKIGKARYSKFQHQIADIINNEQAIRITPDQEFYAFLVFLDLYKSHSTSTSGPFPNQHMLFWVICHMFEWYEFIPKLTLLRTEHKQEEQIISIVTMLKAKEYPIPSKVLAYLPTTTMK